MVTSGFCHGHLPKLPDGFEDHEGTVILISVILIDSHWVPIMWRKDSHHLLGMIANASPDQELAIQDFHGKICRMIGVPISKLSNKTVVASLPDCCGMVALQFLTHMIHGAGPFRISRETVLKKHCEFRGIFIEHLDELVVRPWLWGNGQMDAQGHLVELLRQHGVPDDAIMSRIDMLYKKLGKDEVLKTMRGSQPWRDLKWIANQQVPTVQIVRPTELEKSIAARSTTAPSVGRKHAGGKAKGKGSKGKGSAPTQ